MSSYRKNNPIHVIPSNPIHVTPRPHVGPGKGLNQVCIPSRYPGSGLRGNCQPGLVCKRGEGDLGLPVCRPHMIPAQPHPPHRPSPGQPSPTPHRHSIPTHLGDCVVGGRNNNCGKGHHCQPLSKGKLGGRGLCVPDQDPHHSIPTHLVTDCVVGGANTCGKNNYCKPLSSRTNLGGRGVCAPNPTPIPIVVPSSVGGRCNYSTHPQQPCMRNLVCNKGPGIGGDGTCVIPGAHRHQRPVPVVVPSGVGGRCNYSTHPQQPCKSNLVCNKGPGIGGDGTCVIPGAHRHQRPVPAHLALPDWDIGVGEADFGNISIANVGDIYLPVQNYMGEEGPGPQAQSMWRPGQDKNYHYK